MKNKFQIMSNGQAAESFLHKKRKYSPLFKITICKKEGNVMSKIQKKQQNTFSSYNIQILKETDLKCSFCEREISQFIKIYCRNCGINKPLCIFCFFNHNLKNPLCKYYSILPKKKSSHIFSNNWTYEDEINLLTGIEQFGFDNWEPISSFVETKTVLECICHYHTFYLNGIIDNKYVVINRFFKKGQLKILAENQNKENKCYAELLKEKRIIPPRCLRKKNKSMQIEKQLGFFPKRNEFEIKYLDSIEFEIGNLEFPDGITQVEFENKMKILQYYNSVLDKREYLESFAVEWNFLKDYYDYLPEFNNMNKELKVTLVSLMKCLNKKNVFKMLNLIDQIINLKKRLTLLNKKITLQ